MKNVYIFFFLLEIRPIYFTLAKNREQLNASIVMTTTRGTNHFLYLHYKH